MRSCKTCGTQYSDDTLSFCLQDGTPLSEADAQTVVFDEIPTLERGAGRGSSPLKPVRTGSNTVIAVLLTAFGMLLLFGVAGLGVWLYFRGPDGKEVANSNTNVNTSIPHQNASSSPANRREAATPKPTPVRTPAVERTPPPPARSSYPSVTRLKFPRGAVTVPFAGDINPGDERSLVLLCRAGQQLTAQLTGGGSCVNIQGGGDSYRTSTTRGDNYITLTNRCSEVVRFSIRVTVL